LRVAIIALDMGRMPPLPECTSGLSPKRLAGDLLSCAGPPRNDLSRQDRLPYSQVNGEVDLFPALQPLLAAFTCFGRKFLWPVPGKFFQVLPPDVT
jgi:hypothetical protein